MKKPLFVMLSIFIAIIALHAEETTARLPPPSDADLAKATKTVREAFKDDFAKKALTDRMALAGRLVESAKDASNPPAVRYYLLDEASRTFIEGLDFVNAFAAVDQIARAFMVDAATRKTKLLANALTKAATQEAMSTIGANMISLADDCVGEERYDAALELLTMAGNAAAKSRDASLLALSKERMEDVRNLQTEARRVESARETLGKNPDDPQANLALGKFLCFFKRAWGEGLPLLAKGSDRRLKELAEADLSKPTEANARMTLGDGWWEVAERQSGSAKARVRERSVAAYRAAQPGLNGIAKTKVENRLKAASDASGTGKAPAFPVAGKFYFIQCGSATVYLNGKEVGRGGNWDAQMSTAVTLRPNDVVVVKLSGAGQGMRSFRLAFISTDKRWAISLDKDNWWDVSTHQDIKAIKPEQVHASPDKCNPGAEHSAATASWRTLGVVPDLSKPVWGSGLECIIAFVVEEKGFQPR